MLSGFRIDGFSVIKPRVTHAPSSDKIWDTSSFLEDRLISPAILYIQVSALKVLSTSVLLLIYLPSWHHKFSKLFSLCSPPPPPPKKNIC